MTFDMNDVAPQQSSDLIPDGTFAKVTMSIRKGGVDGMSEVDRGLLKPSNQPGSDVLMVDAEFTVAEGPFARRKFWQNFTVQGGKLDEQGRSVGWKISKSQFRAMIDSALGLNPEDMSEAAKAKRVLRGLADLDGITFVAKIQVEPNRNPAYKDANKLDHVVLPTAPEWQTADLGRGISRMRDRVFDLDGRKLQLKFSRTLRRSQRWTLRIATDQMARQTASGCEVCEDIPRTLPRARPRTRAHEGDGPEKTSHSSHTSHAAIKSETCGCEDGCEDADPTSQADSPMPDWLREVLE